MTTETTDAPKAHTMSCLDLPLSKEVYDKLPLALKLLSWHVAPEDKEAFAAYLQGNYKTVSTRANWLWFQDYTGIPEITNLAAKRSALVDLGLNPSVITARVKTHMVFDHSVRTKGSLKENIEDEVRLNYGRIRIAKWSKAMGIEVVPPDKGVIHQVNLEKLLPVFNEDGKPVFGKGTDSHSPMVNALGILAWGVGGAEAQKVFADEAIGMEIPKCYAVRLNGKLARGISSSDLALYLKKVLRDVGVVSAFVEFIGEGVDTLPLEGRATIANVAAEFGSRTALFGIDEETIRFLALSGRHEGVEKRAKAYGLWRSPEAEDNAVYTEVIDVELGHVKRGISGPNTPHNWVALEGAKERVKNVFVENGVEDKNFLATDAEGVEHEVPNGALLLASLASCTHTANPDAILKAALMMKAAVEKGLKVKPWVKTAFASGSRLADQYLDKLDLTQYIEQLGFGITAHGCGACIGQSGGLNAFGELTEHGFTPTSIVSANRNYAGRQDGKVSISFLAAPDLIVAYAIAGRIDVDIADIDLGGGVRLADITPTDEKIGEAKAVINKDMHTAAYADLFKGTPEYEAVETPQGEVYDWPDDVLVKKPPFFDGITAEPASIAALEGAAVLGMFGDNFSTDAISPAGEPIQIAPAREYLISQGVRIEDFLSIGGYRSNPDVLASTIFANPTNQNSMVAKKGGYTKHHPSGEEGSIFAVAKRYREEGSNLVVIGGENYGCGSSRVMAASGPWMLGVRAVIAVSYEAIHRSNLWQLGIVPFCFQEGESAESFGFDGSEKWDIPLNELADTTETLKATVTRANGEAVEVTLTVELEDKQEFEFLQHGGAMQQQLRELATA